MSSSEEEQQQVCCVCGETACFMCPDCEESYYCGEKCFDSDSANHTKICKKKEEDIGPRMVPPPPNNSRRDRNITYYNAPGAPERYGSLENLFPDFDIDSWFSSDNAIRNQSIMEFENDLQQMTLARFCKKYVGFTPTLYYWVLDTALEFMQLTDQSPNNEQHVELNDGYAVQHIFDYAPRERKVLQVQLNTRGDFGQVADLILEQGMTTELLQKSQGGLQSFSGERYMAGRFTYGLPGADTLFDDIVALWMANTGVGDVILKFELNTEAHYWSQIF